jgi:hypothetical protein
MDRVLRASRRCAALALVCVGLGCAHRRTPADQRSEPVDVALAVTNHHFVDVTIFVGHDGQRTRVGTVTAASTEHFRLPWRLLRMSRQFRLLGEVIGSSETVSTEVLTIQPGQSIEWTLEHDLRRSSVGVY